MFSDRGVNGWKDEDAKKQFLKMAQAALELKSKFDEIMFDADAAWFSAVKKVWTGPHSSDPNVMAKLMQRVADDCEAQYGGN